MTGLPHRPGWSTGATVPAASGGAAGQAPRGAAIYHVADLIAVAMLVMLRAAMLLLAGGIELADSAKWRSPATSWWLLAGLACLSAAMFARAGRRVAARVTRPPFDAATVVTETVTGVAALLVLAYAVTPSARASSDFWAEPYAVISAVTIAAAARRAWPGALAVTCLTCAYLASVLSGLPAQSATRQAVIATAWTNAMSYLAFYALAFLGFRLLRSTTGQAETLRQMIAGLSAERSRVAAAGRAYQIGHDIPKALLREVRRATMTPERLRAWAPQFRADLLAELDADPRTAVDLREELARIAATYAAGMQLDVDLTAMAGQPTGLPALLMAEAVRELLNNASYHRYGYSAGLTAESTDQHVEVSVHNEGPGVEPRRLASAWARKQNTVHQFEAAGGGYQIHSAPQSAAGTTVVLRYPADLARGATAPYRSHPAADTLDPASKPSRRPA
jgi:hypothetical protein